MFDYVFKENMVEIICPHCEEEIALDDNASGEFVCPLCDGDFEWNIQSEAGLEPNWFQDFSGSKSPKSTIRRIISRGIFGTFFLSGIAMVIVGIAGLSIGSSVWASLGDSSSSDNLGGIGIIIVMGMVVIGILLSISIGLIGLIIFLAGLFRMLSK